MPMGITGKDKYTEYKLDGEPIVVAKKRGRPVKYRNPLYVDQDKKIEVAALYTVLGDIKKTAELTGVSEKQIQAFREEPWWAEVQKQVMVQENEKLLGVINETVNKTLLNLQDRIENGDVIHKDAKYSKDGELISEAKDVRTPIKARDLSQIFHALTAQRQLMRGEPTSITANSTTEQQLALLQQHFKAFADGKLVEGEAKVITDESGISK